MKIVIRIKGYTYAGFFKKVHYVEIPEKYFLSFAYEPMDSIVFDSVEDANAFIREHRLSYPFEYFTFENKILTKISSDINDYCI
jgi:hypothetical protein